MKIKNEKSSDYLKRRQYPIKREKKKRRESSYYKNLENKIKYTSKIRMVVSLVCMYSLLKNMLLQLDHLECICKF